jgi:hypothetical protein
MFLSPSNQRQLPHTRAFRLAHVSKSLNLGYDNIWMIDEGSSMIVKFDPQGIVRMTLGRKPEAIDYPERYMEKMRKSPIAILCLANS